MTFKKCNPRLVYYCEYVFELGLYCTIYINTNAYDNCCGVVVINAGSVKYNSKGFIHIVCVCVCVCAKEWPRFLSREGAEVKRSG